MERFVAASRAMPRPPATVGTPDTEPHVSGELLPSVYRGAAMSDLPTREQIAGIEVPTTVLAWVEDPAHPLSTAAALVELMPRATLQVAQTPEDVHRWPGVLAADVARHG
jgi:3-oxoadipate enol-lactonase